MKTKIFLTIDTEFSIGGAFADPESRTPVGPQAVMCDINGQSHGLGFLLGTFARSGIRATFFVEVFNSYYFGDQPMGELARAIRAAGHDVQMHLHPCWTYFRDAEWTARLKVDPPTDHMNNRSIAQLVDWFADGIAIFERWGLGRPAALRTGSMMADLAVYKAMDLTGLRFASNIGMGVFRPVDPALHFYSGIQRVEGVTEVCVLTYSDVGVGRWSRSRLLTITGSSWGEIKALLLRARESNIEAVAILTHPFEYVKYRDSSFEGLLPNAINQRRLVRLCEFLRDHDDEFDVCTFSDLPTFDPPLQPGANIRLRVPHFRAAGRMAENLLNDRIRAL